MRSLAGLTNDRRRQGGRNEEETMKTTITRNGQTVCCYGQWREDTNCACLFDDEEFDGIYADGAKSWAEAVEILTAYAERVGTVLVELQAD